MKAFALTLPLDGPVTLAPALDGAGEADLDQRERRAAARALWEARLWMAAVLFGVLVSIVLALLFAPVRALLRD